MIGEHEASVESAAPEVDVDLCRLCGGELRLRFEMEVLGRHKARYSRCHRCHSLQTQTPYWLGEAYAENSLSSLDTGAAHRNLQNLGASHAMAKLFSVRDMLDLGGGDGLLCRLLRDYGLNCFVNDKYAVVTYAQGFTEADFEAPQMVLAFEVLEHFAEPRRELEEVFGRRPDIVLASTEIYRDQDAEWIYLAPETGQHVFFYSRAALDYIAAKYGYRLLVVGSMCLFVRKEGASSIRMVAAGVLLRPRVVKLLTSILLLLPAPGVAKDYSARLAALTDRSCRSRTW